MLSPNPRLGMSNLKAIDPNEDFFASSLYIILFFFFVFFCCGCSPLIIMYLPLDNEKTSLFTL